MIFISVLHEKPSFKGQGTTDISGDICSKCKLCRQETAGVAGGQLGWTGNSWLSTNTKWKYTEIGSRERLRRTRNLSFKYTGMKLGKPKSGRNLNWWGRWQELLQTVGSKRKTHSWMGWMTWWWRRRQIDSVSFCLCSYLQGKQSGYLNAFGSLKQRSVTHGRGCWERM